MSALEDRMKEEMKKANFNLFEIVGFKEKPELAIITGIAIGYKMGYREATEQITLLLNQIAELKKEMERTQP